MDMSAPQTQIFSPAARQLANARARARQARTGRSFLLLRACEDAASRLADINRQFARAALVGPFDVRAEILENLPPDRKPKDFIYAQNTTELDGNCDVVISLLNLQSDEALPQTLRDMRARMRADGLLLAAFFGGDSLRELRQSLYAVDQELLGGACARVYPMVDYSQSAALLGQAGLALPVVDTDRFTVSYTKLSRLIADLRDLGVSNILGARDRRPLPKTYLPKLAQIYAENFARDDGKLQAGFEILWLTGWAPHASQQKPLKPGSAKMRLSDALGTQEQKL